MKKTYREHSRIDWATANDLEDLPDIDRLKFGCLQRIADATEAMAKNYTQLQAEAALFRRWCEEEKAVSKRLARSNAALRGLLKRRGA